MQRELAAVTSRELVAWDVPKLLIAAAQPYHTVAGPALTVNFLQQSTLLPFQQLPFTHSSLLGLYAHTMLHTLAEFAETPRTVRTSTVGQVHAAMDNFWSSVGVLNTFYATHHQASSQHPAMGAVELLRSSHRKECDVKTSFFDEDHRPLVSVLMTGPRNTTVSLGSDPEEELVQRQRMPLASYPSPSTAAEFVPGEAPLAAALATGTLRCEGGLYGEVVSLRGGSYGCRALFRVVQPQDMNVAAATTATASPVVESIPFAAEAAVPSLSVPPWVLQACISDLCQCLDRHQCLVPDGHSADLRSPSNATDGHRQWRLCAQQYAQWGDVEMGVPVDVVCGPPRLQRNARIPPWRHELGKPAISSETSMGAALCVEVRQRGLVQHRGTYHFEGVSLA